MGRESHGVVGLRLAGLGIAIGIACTLLTSQLLRCLLYGVSSTDLVTLSVTPVAVYGRIGLMDDDLEQMSRDALVSEVKRLRTGIRAHRDSTAHDLCWHHPQLWGLLPEKLTPEVAIPPWPRFLRGCLRYRESLERELPNAPVADFEFE